MTVPNVLGSRESNVNNATTFYDNKKAIDGGGFTKIQHNSMEFLEEVMNYYFFNKKNNYC